MHNISFNAKNFKGGVATHVTALSFVYRHFLTFIVAAFMLMFAFLAMPAQAFADETTVDGTTVVYSTEGDAASIEGANFGVMDFTRFQTGSNRQDSETLEYQGYGYYVSDVLGSVIVVSTDDYVLCYVSKHAQAKSECDIDSQIDCDNLKKMILGLDALELNNKGGNPISGDVEWIFTDQESYRQGDVIYNFETELKEGQYWLTVIGVDGNDVASRSGDGTVSIESVDAMTLVDEDEVIIVDTPTGLAAVWNFLTNLNYSPLWITLKTTFTAIIFIFILGLLAAYWSLRISPRWQDIADTIFTIPMVLPPTVCGFLLLLVCGSNTAFGRFFINIGFPLVFSWVATVIAAVVVAFPLMYRSARGAFESLDPNMLNAARTLGWSEGKIFFKLMLPLAWSSIAAGTVLAFARALGEFGATMFMAGNYLGVTRTIPIAIYFEWMNGNTDIALFWTGVILVICFVVILFINLYSRRTTKYRRKVVVDVDEFGGDVIADGDAAMAAENGKGKRKRKRMRKTR